MQSGFRALGSRTGMRLGATWTALIVAQVAVSVAVLPSAFEWAWGALRPGILGSGFASEEFLTARLAPWAAAVGPARGASKLANPTLRIQIND